jgi:hypothetical protein
MVAVCGSDYSDAARNICTNQACANGDVRFCHCAYLYSPFSMKSRFVSWYSFYEWYATQGCLGNYLCYSLPVVDCTDVEAVTTNEPAPISNAIANGPTEEEMAPTPLVAVCGSDYNDAVANICTNQACANGDVSTRTMAYLCVDIHYVFSTISFSS